MTYYHNKKLTPNAKILRKEMTKEERHLWYDFLRSYPVRFLRQKVIDGYIVDFYCAQAKLVIELDGSQHYETEGLEYDKRRNEKLEKLGFLVIRIPNNEVFRNFEAICSHIDKTVIERIKAFKLIPPPTLWAPPFTRGALKGEIINGTQQKLQTRGHPLPQSGHHRIRPR